MGGRTSRSAPPLVLPHQEVVNIHGASSSRAAPAMGPSYLAAANAAAKLSQKCETGQVKMQLAWLAHAFKLQKGSSRNLWEVHGSFSAEVPCTLSVHFHCRERRSMSAGMLTYEAADPQAPSSWSCSYPEGKHELLLGGDKAIDFQRWPLEVFWKLKQKKKDVIPMVFSLELPGAGPDAVVQSVVHMSLDVPKTPDKETQLNLQCKVLRQKVVVNKKEYILEEIYGLADLGKEDGADESSHGEPCVVCLSDPRNTAILPCRHLCLCEECAREMIIGSQLRGDTCPICRGKIANIQVFGVKS